MVDLDWERARSEELGELHEPFLEHDATSFDTSFEIRKSSEKSSSLGDYAVAVFEEITEALDALEGRIVLETSCDEITHTLEQVSYGLLDGRDEQVQTQGVAQQFPQLYDRIHMSNIPDYIGGSLANFLLAVPAITSSSDAFITSCSLRNPSRFSSYRLYHNEYAIANTAEQIEKLFQVRESDTEEIPVFPVMGYRNYHKTQQKALSFPELLPRNEIEIWLHRHFLKLVLPLARDFTSWTMICAPLNLSVFFRLLEHLHRVGYPAHWLSSVLSDLLVGSITTRARAPRSDPLSIAEVNTALTERKQSIAPFLTELATLSAIWEPVLPFGSVESTRLPDPHHIYRHTIRFEKAVLNDDEQGSQKPSKKRLRHQGSHMLTMFGWDWPRKEASFWMPRDVMRKMKAEGNFICWLWRTDIWDPQCPPEIVDRNIKEGSSWTEFVKAGGSSRA